MASNPEYLTAEEAAYIEAHTGYNEEGGYYDDEAELELMFKSGECCIEELSLTPDELHDYLVYNMKEVLNLGERIEDHVPFMECLIKRGMYKPVSDTASRQKARVRASVFMAQLRSECETGKKRNSSVMLDEDERNERKEILTKLEQARRVWEGD